MKPNWAAIGALLIAITLSVVVVFVVFIPNPTEQSNRQELRENQERLYRFICAQAQTQANAFRFRQVTPGGELEGVRHFLTRMLAQKEVLELSKGLGCKSTPGFPPFDFQVERALKQIGEILQRFSPQLRHAIAEQLESSAPESGQEATRDPPEHKPLGQAGIGEHQGKEATKRPPFQIPREPGAQLPPTEARPTIPIVEPIVNPILEAVAPPVRHESEYIEEVLPCPEKVPVCERTE